MKIFPSEAKVSTAFKWMYLPKDKIILVSNGENHSDTLKWFINTEKVESEFYEWIRFIHLSPSDFKFKTKKHLLCVRLYPEELMSKSDVKALVKTLKIKSRIVFDVTNELLGEMTQDFLKKW